MSNRRRDGIFDDERVLVLSRAMEDAGDRLFARFYSLAGSRVSDEHTALKLFVDGLASIRDWTQQTLANETRRAKRAHPRADVAYRYAIMRYVQELYSHEPDSEVQFTPPAFEAFVWHYFRIAARKRHIVSGAFLRANERTTQRFARATIRDTFDRLLRSSLRVRKIAATANAAPAVPSPRPPSPGSNPRPAPPPSQLPSAAFDQRVREAMKRRQNANANDNDDDNDDGSVISGSSSSSPIGDGADDATDEAAETGNDPVTATSPPVASPPIVAKKRVDMPSGRPALPTRSRARNLEALGRSRRSRRAETPPPAADMKSPDDVVLESPVSGDGGADVSD